MQRFCMIEWFKPNIDDVHASSAIIVCVIGIGALSMAFAFAQAGPVYGSIAFAVMCFFNVYATILLSKVMMRAPSFVQTYADIGQYVCGKWGRRAVICSQLTSCLTVPIAFLVLGGASLLPEIFADIWNPSESIWIILMSLTLMPFVLIRNLKEALIVMIIGTATAFFSIFTSVGQSAAEKSWNEYEATVVKFSNVLPVFGNFALAYGAALIIPTVQRNHSDQRRLPMNIFFSMMIISFIYISIAVIGYAQFGCAAPDNMLLSMERNGWKTAVFLSMQLHVMISFAVVVNPALYTIEQILFGSANSKHNSEFEFHETPTVQSSSTTNILNEDQYGVCNSDKVRVSVSSSRTGEIVILTEKDTNTDLSLTIRLKSFVLRSVVVAIQTFLALLGQSSFADIGSFIGATTHTVSCIILPCFFYYKAFRSEMTILEKLICWIVIIVSAGCGIFTAYKKMDHIIEVASQYELFALADKETINGYPYCPDGYVERHMNTSAK